MATQDAIDSFREALKLAPSEAAIYVHLCLAGPAKAGDLAGALKLHRNDVYRNTARLVARGLVEMTMERPARYAAVRPERVFEDEMASRLAAVEELKSARTKVTAMLETLHAPQAIERRSVYKVIQGRQEIGSALAHLVEHATRSLVWASTFPAGIRHLEVGGVLDLLAKRVDEGVGLRAGIRSSPQGWEALAPLAARPNVQLRELKLEGDIRFMIVDASELLMWVVNDPSEAFKAKDEVAIQTTAPGFVQAELVFFEQAWANARPRV